MEYHTNTKDITLLYIFNLMSNGCYIVIAISLPFEAAVEYQM